MPLYGLIRRVVWSVADQGYREAWGIDRVTGSLLLPTVSAPRDTDRDDPVNAGPNFKDARCAPMLTLRDGRLVTWQLMMEFLSEAEEVGYTLISGFEKMSPYSVLVLRGP